ncbi:hypothetical protein TRVL_02686 [Trypanosoma vivax]|nr:hypothetical protein TRVL_02686 [Trypanosoma vivax]
MYCTYTTTAGDLFEACPYKWFFLCALLSCGDCFSCVSVSARTSREPTVEHGKGVGINRFIAFELYLYAEVDLNIPQTSQPHNLGRHRLRSPCHVVSRVEYQYIVLLLVLLF